MYHKYRIDYFEAYNNALAAAAVLSVAAAVEAAPEVRDGTAASAPAVAISAPFAAEAEDTLAPVASPLPAAGTSPPDAATSTAQKAVGDTAVASAAAVVPTPKLVPEHSLSVLLKTAAAAATPAPVFAVDTAALEVSPAGEAVVVRRAVRAAISTGVERLSKKGYATYNATTQYVTDRTACEKHIVEQPFSGYAEVTEDIYFGGMYCLEHLISYKEASATLTKYEEILVIDLRYSRSLVLC